MAELAVLSLTLDTSGLKSGAGEATRVLEGVGATGDAVAVRVSTGISGGFREGVQDARVFVSKLRAELDAQMRQIQSASASGLLSPRDAAAAGQAAGREYRKAIELELKAARVEVTGPTRDGYLSGLSTQLEQVNAGGRNASVGINSLRGAMTSLASSATGVQGPIGSVAGILSQMAVGGGVTVGILAGLTLLVAAFDALTESARRTQKAAADAHDELAKLRKERETPTGQAASRVSSLETERVELQRQLAVYEKLAESSAAAGPLITRTLAKIATNQRDLAQAIGETARARRSELDTGGEQLANYISQLAQLRQLDPANKAVADEVTAQAAALRANGLAVHDNNAERARLLGLAKELTDAERAATGAAKEETKEHRAAAEALKLRAAAAAGAAQQQREFDVALQKTNAVYAESARNPRQAPVLNRGTDQTFADVVAEQEAGLQRVASTADQIRDNFARGFQETLARGFTDVFTNGLRGARAFFDSFKKLALDVLGQIASAAVLKRVAGSALGGLLGLTSAATPALAGAQGGVLARTFTIGTTPSTFGAYRTPGLGAGTSISNGALAGSTTGAAVAPVAVIPGPSTGFGTSALSTLAVAGSAFGVGSAVGGLTSNRGVGALGGAAAGAATGALLGSVLPGIGTAFGAVVGGMVGALGGLIGAHQKAKAAAEAMAKAQSDFATGLRALQLEASGGNALQAALAQNDATRAALVKKADEAYPTSKNEAQRNIEIAKVDAAAQQNATRIGQEFSQTLYDQIQGAQARILAATGNTRAAEDITRAVKAQQEYNEALKQYGQNVADAVKAANDAEDAQVRAARARADQRANEDLTVRGLRAGGNSTGADTLAFQLTQQREYVDAQLAGMTQAFLDHLAAVQQAEATLFAAEQQRIHDTALGDAQARTLAAQGRTVEADAIRIQIQYEQERTAALKLGADVLAEVTKAQDAETAARKRQIEIQTRTARAGYAADVATLTGDDRAAFWITQAEQTQQAIDKYEELQKAGVITAAEFDHMKDLLLSKLTPAARAAADALDALQTRMAALRTATDDASKFFGAKGTSNADQLTYFGGLYGFTGKSDTEITAGLHDPTKGTLSDADRLDNQRIYDYLDLEKRLQTALVDTVTNATTTPPGAQVGITATASGSAFQGYTAQSAEQANGLMRTQLAVLREQTGLLRQIARNTGGGRGLTSGDIAVIDGALDTRRRNTDRAAGSPTLS